jgi:ankyrin repeat protein
MILNWPDNYGRTPLHYAVKNENLTIIKILVQARANLFFRDHKSRVRMAFVDLYFRDLLTLVRTVKKSKSS